MNKNNSKQKNTTTRNHVFRRVRDPVLDNAAASTPSMQAVTTNSSGVTNGILYLSPVGVVTPTLTVSAGALSGTNATLETPRLPWFWNQARNFERYRVLNATIVFVANVGTTSIGSLTVVSSTDAADAFFTSTAPSKSTGGKTIALAVSGSREQRFPLDISSAWKPVTSNTLYVANATVQTLYAMNSINDVCFSFVSYAVTGAAASTNVGNFYLEYDVEFKDPISYAQNA